MIFGESKKAEYIDLKEFQSAFLKRATKDDPKVLDRQAIGRQVEFNTDWEKSRAKEVASTKWTSYRRFIDS